MGYNCCVPQCNSATQKGEKSIKFHKFPSDKCMLAEWKAVIRTGKHPSVHSKVCSKHFTDEDYKVTSMGEWKILRPTAVPSQCLPKRSHDKPPKENNGREQRRLERARRLQSEEIVNATAVMVSDLLQQDISSGSSSQLGPTEQELEEPQCNSNTEQQCPDVASMTKSTQTFINFHNTQFIEFETLSDEEIKYFTGFETERFECVFEFVSKGCTVFPTTSCSRKDQLLATLCKYKHNLDFKMIGFMFRVSPRIISQLFTFWTNLIYSALKCVDFWSLGNQDSTKYRAIIDCTEIPIDKSENPEIHQLTYSQYKNRPTFKCLVGIDEAGTVVFCSDLYGGSTSDRQIVILSKFVDLVSEGETILADRGFEISDLLEKKKVALNIPPFLRGKKQLTEKEVMATRKLANRRIHVERLIGLSKINTILNEPMPSHLWPIANKIVYNCTFLCNFKPRIVNAVPRKFRKRF